MSKTGYFILAMVAVSVAGFGLVDGTFGKVLGYGGIYASLGALATGFASMNSRG